MKSDLNIYKYKDYKKFILAQMHQLQPPRGRVSRLAEAANCQASYLSQVLHGKAHLTPDHALGITQHLNFSDLQTNYFLLMVDLARASTPALKMRLEKQMASLRSEADQISSRLERPKIDLSPEQLQRYYSSSSYSAAHIMTSIEPLQNAKLLSHKLNLSEKRTVEILHFLFELGFVIHQGNQWSHSGREVHIPKESPLIGMHHANWRHQAVLDAQSSHGDGVHFTGVYSLSASDFDTVKEILLKTLKQAQNVISPSACEEAVCLNLDYFKI